MIYLSCSLLILLHFYILNSIQFTAWPEMFSYAYLFNNGFLPYKDFVLPYQPLLVFIQSPIYKIFGYGVNTLVYFTYSVILLNDLIISYLSLRILGKKWISCIPLLFYVFIQPAFEGNQLWFDLASTPFLLFGLVSLIILENQKKRFFLAGLFWSMAFLVKQQHVIIFIAFFIFLILSKKFKELYSFLIGWSLPVLGVLVYVFLFGTFNDYWFWSVVVPIVWYPKMPGYATWPGKRELVTVSLIFLPVIVGLVKDMRKNNLASFFSLLVFVATFAIAFPRFSLFRMQNAVVVFPVVLIFFLKNFSKNSLLFLVPSLLFVLIMFNSIFPFKGGEVRFYSREDKEFSKIVESNISKGRIVYLFGPHSLGYVLSGTLPPKPWIDNFIWYMEIPGVQEKVIVGLESSQVDVIYRALPYNGKWYELGTYQPKKINDYINQKYVFKERLPSNIEIWERIN